MTALDWLLAPDADPAIRWQARRDLTDASAEEVAAERAKVVTEGWGARLLAARDEKGLWAGGACFPANFDWASMQTQGQPWTSTFPSLDLLREFGLDPASEVAREAIEQVDANCFWEHDGQPFFSGEVEECINGKTVAIGSYFGRDMTPVVERLLGDQMSDGGWNCERENGSVVSSFNSTLCVLEGLLGHERAVGGDPKVAEARERGQEYLLERRLFRRLSTGEPADPDFLLFSFPPRWHYDVLRGLDYFRSVGGTVDRRLDEALEHVRNKQQDDGTWLLEQTYRGAVHFPLEDGDGKPSRWNMLRALRVLRWADQD